jgi:hypothetical protein
MVQSDQQDLKDHLDPRGVVVVVVDRQDLLGQPDLTALKVLKAFKVFKEFKAPLGLKVFKEYKVLKEYKG